MSTKVSLTFMKWFYDAKESDDLNQQNIHKHWLKSGDFFVTKVRNNNNNTSKIDSSSSSSTSTSASFLRHHFNLFMHKNAFVHSMPNLNAKSKATKNVNISFLFIIQYINI